MVETRHLGSFCMKSIVFGHARLNSLVLMGSMSSSGNPLRSALVNLGIVAATILGSVAATAPASAAGTAQPGTIYLPSCSSTSWRTGPSGGGSALPAPNGPGNPISAGNGDTITVVNECNTTVYINVTGAGYGSWTALAGSGTSTFTFANNALNIGAYTTNDSSNQLIAMAAITGTYIGPANDGGVVSSSATVAPVSETLLLAVESSGASCTGGNPTGYSGSWLALPKAEDCKQTGPNAKVGAKLLGWSPNANFPVEVAQNQIARGWGVYDGPIGGVRMIFIPAGMSTFVSGSNTLYPVWSA